MIVRFKKTRQDAVAPKRATDGSAGWDFTAVDYRIDLDKHQIKYYTGIAVEIPDGFVGLCFPRSSICNTSLRLSNCVGVIDSDYRGEVTAVFDQIASRQPLIYDEKDRIFQMVIVPVPNVEFVESEELSETKRGQGGYGSTGR